MGKKGRDRARRVHWTDDDESEIESRHKSRSAPKGRGDQSDVDRLKYGRSREPTLYKFLSTDSGSDVSDDESQIRNSGARMWGSGQRRREDRSGRLGETTGHGGSSHAPQRKSAAVNDGRKHGRVD